MAEWSPDIGKLQARDDTEWSRVEREFSGRLLAYAQRRTGDLQAAEDVVQESLLGAVRGILEFDPLFTFEQYLFGICRNRTIDHLRRRRARTLPTAGDDEGEIGLDQIARDAETPSAIVRGDELSARARRLLGDVLAAWVEETWAEGEHVRLCVVEALLSGGWRNRDTWQRFGLRDETSVAGIKFRALKRLRQLAAVRESGSDLLRWLAAAEEGHRILEVDVQEVWRERRVSCPDRRWLARQLLGTAGEGPTRFLGFHLGEMRCPWCLANRDDLDRRRKNGELTAYLAEGGLEPKAGEPLRAGANEGDTAAPDPVPDA
jgi:RNA polymerase sigma-70 factor, ECF subfamily